MNHQISNEETPDGAEEILEELKENLVFFTSVHYDGRKGAIVKNLNVVSEDMLDDAVEKEFKRRERSLVKGDFRVDFSLVEKRRELKRDNKRLRNSLETMESSDRYLGKSIEEIEKKIEENEERIEEINEKLEKKLDEFKNRVVGD
ncbi:hypothetical protein AKJ61_00810 [candidate division MSBL1 archaeon SCGC-AAA259B11]|uniref:Uncharacterized protein n=1 Tax=candidate division MSBL1 archaeon SCGC-AAA259B11 TaxID=1698260 RepID=A0A133U852_9EURY|nr:hypothetical protein AKJ61_00810 [candidate division MSBL1 archaeon SCGC-AAA259B11]